MAFGAAWPILHEETVQRLLPLQAGVQILQGVTGPAQSRATPEQLKRKPCARIRRPPPVPREPPGGAGPKGSRPAPLPWRELLAALEPKNALCSSLAIIYQSWGDSPRPVSRPGPPGLVPWPRLPWWAQGVPAAVRLWLALTVVGQVGSSVAPLCKAGFGSPGAGSPAPPGSNYPTPHADTFTKFLN